MKFKLIHQKILLSLLICIDLASINTLSAKESPEINFQSNGQPSINNNFFTPPKDIEFVESAIEKGIIFQHNERDYELSGLKDTLGNGVCIIDIDNDGYEDIFALGGKGVTRRYGKKHWWNNNQASKLFRNVNGAYFSDVTRIIDTSDSIAGYGCATGDLNNDGFSDLVIGGRENIILLINQLGESFNKKTISIDKNSWPMSITLWDANKDGFLDILIANFAQFNNDIKVGAQDYGYKSNSQFKSENFSGQQNLLLTNTTPANKNKSIEFMVTHLEGYDKSFSIAPLGLLNLDELPEYSNTLLIANAKGSTSKIQPNHVISSRIGVDNFQWLKKLKTPLVQVTKISLLNEPAVLLTQHQTGGFQLYNTNDLDADDLSWQLAINSDSDNITPTWATLVADFNNDGFEDIISAKGFSTPHIDNAFRPQGSRNTYKMQTASGTFNDNNVSISPNLSRASRGAAFADFNNDGRLDVVFNNNNNNLSLYINKSTTNNWLSIICVPLYLCEESTWEISNDKGEILATDDFSKNQPFLSSNQKRLHYAFKNINKKLNISAYLNDGTIYTYSNVNLNNTYRIDVKEQSIHQIIKPNNKIVKPVLSSLINAPLYELLPMLSHNIKLSISELTTLAQYLNVYKLSENDSSTVLSPEFITLTSWLLNQALQYEQLDSALMKSIIRLIGRSESSLFADHIVYLIEALKEDNFCHLTKEIHQWFWEEETATKSKQLFKAPLIYKIINSHSSKEMICGLDAISVSRDTTLGQSLLPLLENKNIPFADTKSVQAAAIRTFGLLKNNKTNQALISFCNTSADSLIIAECIISLNKLGESHTDITQLFSDRKLNRSVLILHPDNIMLAPILKYQVSLPLETNTETFNANSYFSSKIAIHSMIAHVVNLTSAQNDDSRVEAINKLLLTKNKKNILNIAKQWQSLEPDSINDYFFLSDLPNYKLYWLLPFANNKTIERILFQYSNSDTSYEFDYALAQQCQLRQTLKPLCNIHLTTPGYLNTKQIKVLLNEYNIKLIYALMSDNITKRKTTAIALFNYSVQLLENSLSNQEESTLEIIFSLLRINNLYTLLNTNQIKQQWLSKFIIFTQGNHLKLNKIWVESLHTSIKQEAQSNIRLITSPY